MEASETSVSIVVPAFNEAGRIAESVRRIDTFIRQSQVPLDLIIVDDGSTDKTAEVVSGLNAKSLRLIRRYIEIHQSRLRELGGIVFNQMVRVLLGLRLHDTQCGFKLFHRERSRRVFEKLTTFGFGFDPELLYVAKRHGLKIREAPVRWSHAEGSKVKFLRDGVGMFLDLLRIRWNALVGRYS